MINVVIPMAGKGQRFIESGYDKPKPMIDVCGVPMIQRVIDSLSTKNINCNYIFIALQEHLNNGLKEYLENKGTIIPLNYVTEGAASTTLMAMKHINTDDPLVIANCDQYLEWDFEDYIKKSEEYDGSVVVSHCLHFKIVLCFTTLFNVCMLNVLNMICSNHILFGFYMQSQKLSK
jgi:NDP-sugar pyrophosphorylase family protein